jgi:hypothetical protein
MPRTLAVIISRLRFPLLIAVLAVLIVTLWTGPELPWWLRIGVLLVVMYVVMRVGTVRDEPTEIGAPVRGRWSALNSPADRVPSHGVQGYGQAYAIDLVYEPEQPPHRPEFAAWWPFARPARAFPGFGQPVHAVAAGTVVRTSGWQRDHWSRNSTLGLVYLIFEGLFRELTGAGRILGNHVVIDLGGGVYAAYAHLKRGSIAVKRGDRVTEGQVIAACGNSGNSSEPHLHFQLMDHAHATIAAGLPMRFHGVEIDGRAEPGVPRAGNVLQATGADSRAS